jgi:Ca-activated chloride channel homolog
MYRHKKKTILIVGWLIVSFSASGMASSKQAEVRKGNDLFTKGSFEDSVKRYEEALKKDPESDIINFNLGTALYKKGDYAQSLSHLQKSLLTDVPALKQKTYYNLGNAFYKDGIRHEKEKIDQAISSLEQSIKQYESALSLNKDDQDAAFNLEFVKKELERLKKEQEKQKQAQQDKQNQDQQNKQNQDQENQQNNNQQQNQSQQNKEQNQQDGSSGDQQNSSSQDKPKEDKEPSQQEQAKDKKDQDEQNKDKDQSPEREPAASKDQPSKDQEGSAPKDARELSEKEAQMLLERYEQNEAPQKMFGAKIMEGRNKESVLKDW